MTAAGPHPPMWSEGQAWPLGATVLAEGIQFALLAPDATQVRLCLFRRDRHDGRDDRHDDRQPDADLSPLLPICDGEPEGLPLPVRTNGVWHGVLRWQDLGITRDQVGTLRYAYRVDGPWAPERGHRFDPHALLLDPYAKAVDRIGVDQRRNSDTTCAVPQLLARVPDPAQDPTPLAWQDRPKIPTDRMVIYEAHVRGLTKLHPAVPEPLRGTYAGLAHPAVLDHLQALGITTLSLMPVQAFVDEPRLTRMGLRNYWGYNPIAWFAPEPRYASGDQGLSPRQEFRAMVDALHARGLEVLIDVVYNHTAESDVDGPTLSLRGIANRLYYQLPAHDLAGYENWSGCGNCVNVNEPGVLALVMDSLRDWAVHLGVDGFRFDLAPILARQPDGSGWSAHAAFFGAIRQDPVLGRLKLIAEPWDIGPGGYRLGQFPAGWQEWNDQYRDTVRSFWVRPYRIEPALAGGNPTGQQAIGDPEQPASIEPATAEPAPWGATRGELAHRLAGSAEQFGTSQGSAQPQRHPDASVNFLCAHDGFTLRDLVSYNQRHNHANGEHNRDGHSHNHSWNCGEEGPSDRADVALRRARLQQAMLTTLLVSLGTPMLLAGDEFSHSQRGNNNAYCQDNATTWLHWPTSTSLGSDTSDQGPGHGPDLRALIARLTRLRQQFAALRSRHWWRDGQIGWYDALGQPLTPDAWQDPHQACLSVWVRATDAASGAPSCPGLLLLFNADRHAQRFDLAALPAQFTLLLRSDDRASWAEPGCAQALDTAAIGPNAPLLAPLIPAHSVWIAVQDGGQTCAASCPDPCHTSALSPADGPTRTV